MNNIDNKIINFASFNCRGIRNVVKRANIFEWLRESYKGIILLQETHSCPSDHNKWSKEWKGDIIFAHGEYNAKGVAILIPDNLTKDINIKNQIIDPNGRYIFLECKFFETELIVCNLYFPTKDKREAQENFYLEVKSILEKYGDKNILMAGDLNTYLEISIDKKGGAVESESKFSKNIKNLMEEFDLVDIWRTRNPLSKTYTRRENSKKGLVQSRLDYWLVSIGIAYQIQNVYIKPGNSSDHSIIGIKIKFNDISKRGKGFWKFNNDLLNDKKYIELVKNIIKKTLEEEHFTDKNMLWEFLKCEIRTHTLHYAGKRARENSEKVKYLGEKIERLEKNLDDHNYAEYLQSKGEWEGLNMKKTNGILLRSKAVWIESGEKNTKYFLNLEKRNYNTKNIKSLITVTNTEISKLSEIIHEKKTFYENLYDSKLIKNETNNFLNQLELDNEIPKLTDEEKNLCDEFLTIQECGKALKLLPNNKSPGSDGFTTNFFKFFWPDIKHIVYNSFIYSFEHGNLTQNQKMGILNLLPKKEKDLRYLANWRPVSLLNTDYKILTKALAIRLQKVIPSIINYDQVGYIKDRYIGENVRIIFDLLKYCDINEIEAFLIQVDFEKAFDSIEWPFLFKCLESFNFGENFCKWIKIFYNDISSCVGNNGHYSKYFKLKRSIRQGCPISALLFLLVAEMLAIKIRNDPNINGITINETEYKLSMMADDTTLIVTNLDSFGSAIKIFKEFSDCSGLKLNLNKTEIIPIGKSKQTNVQIPIHLREIKIKHGPFKALGVWFADTQEIINNLNFDDRIKNMETTINIWKCRSLSLKGKITIIKTLILPQVQFLFSMVYVGEKIINRIEKLLYSFIWNNNVHKIKKSTLIAPIEFGGLGMIDVRACNLTAKGTWIRRLLGPECSKWKTLTWYMLNINKYNLITSNCLELNKQGKSPFHTQILNAWSEINSFEPKTLKEIVNQNVVGNKFIKIDNKPIRENFLGTNKLKIGDLINKDWTIINKITLEQKLGTQITMLKYNSITQSFPKKWKEKITKTVHSTNVNTILETTNSTNIQIQIRNNLKNLEIITSKEIYLNLIQDKFEPPTSITTWIDRFPFLENINWRDIYELPYKIVSEPYLQSYQYKIINRILNCNERLNKWKIKDGPECDSCGEIDTIDHRLYNCRESKKIWEGIYKWIKENFDIKITFTICEVLFGMPANNDVYIKLFNFIILIVKWFINKKKEQNKPLYVLEALILLKNKIESIVLANTLYIRENKAWQTLIYNAVF